MLFLFFKIELFDIVFTNIKQLIHKLLSFFLSSKDLTREAAGAGVTGTFFGVEIF